MTNDNEWRTSPPNACPYCDETGIARLSDHLPCDAVPSTEEVIDV